jgi:DNA-binding MarR family transcriptional regulator
LRERGALDYDRLVARGERAEFVERFRTMNRFLKAVAARAYATLEVGSTQAMFLRHIGHDSRISQAELARATETAPTLTGRAIESLVDRGWVRRKRSEEDRRQYVLELTAAGQRARERVEEARDAIMDRITRALDERDLEDFERISRKLRAAFADVMDGAGEESPAVEARSRRA